MAVWLSTGAHPIGVEGGIVRRADLAELVQVCDLHARAIQELADASGQALRIVEEARVQAQGTLEQARAEADAIREQARIQGMQEAAERWAMAAVERALDHQEKLERASGRLADIVTLATQRVLEAADRGELYRRALRAVRDVAREAKSVVLRVSGADEAQARALVTELGSEFGFEVPVEVRVEHDFGAGDCVLEADHCVIDASLGLQLDAVKRAIGQATRQAIARTSNAVAEASAQDAPGTSETLGHGLPAQARAA